MKVWHSIRGPRLAFNGIREDLESAMIGLANDKKILHVYHLNAHFEQDTYEAGDYTVEDSAGAHNFEVVYRPDPDNARVVGVGQAEVWFILALGKWILVGDIPKLDVDDGRLIRPERNTSGSGEGP